MAFSTDADYYIPGMSRGEVVIDFLKSWKASGIPTAEVLKIMTTNGYKVCDLVDKRGPIKVGLPADLIAVRGNPLDDLETLRDVRFVMKDGTVFKRDGLDDAGEVLPQRSRERLANSLRLVATAP